MRCDAMRVQQPSPMREAYLGVPEQKKKKKGSVARRRVVRIELRAQWHASRIELYVEALLTRVPFKPTGLCIGSQERISDLRLHHVSRNISFKSGSAMNRAPSRANKHPRTFSRCVEIKSKREPLEESNSCPCVCCIYAQASATPLDQTEV